MLDNGRKFWSNSKLVIYRQQNSTYWWIGPELDGDYVAFVNLEHRDLDYPPRRGLMYSI